MTVPELLKKGAELMKRSIAWLLAVYMFMTVPAAAAQASDTSTSAQTTNQPPLTEGISAEREDVPSFLAESYNTYSSRHADAAFAAQAVSIDIASPTASKGRAKIEVADGSTVAIGGDDSSFTWTFDVPSDGLFELEVTYRRGKDNTGVIQRALYIDGKMPFREAGFIDFSPPYRLDIDGDTFAQDARGDDIRPEQVQSDVWQTKRLLDPTGYHNEPLRFFFKAGRHTLTLEGVKGSLELAALTLETIKSARSYSDLMKEYSDKGYALAKAEPIRLEAEHPTLVSSISVFPSSDKSSTATYPQSPKNDKLNVIAGDQYRNAGRWVSYSFNIKEPGLYRIALRYRQNTSTGPFATRRLEIDGELPFAEAADLRFYYSSKWRAETLGTDGEEFLFYFDKGEHTLRLTATMGAYAKHLNELQAVQRELQALYRQIYRITGSQADPERDYDFLSLIPDTVAGLSRAADRLYELIDEIDSMTENSRHLTASLKKTAYQTKTMGENHRQIARLMSAFEGNISAMQTWILNLSYQPLTLDALCVYGEGEMPLTADDGFFSKARFAVRAFFISFFTDYEKVGSTGDGSDITVWLTTGRDQLKAVRRLIDSSFTPREFIGVNLQLVAPGTLMPATLAGIGPDVVIAGGSEVELALRGAIIPLDGLEGFDEVAARFDESAFTPLSLSGHVYALPETQSFYMMFCRDDILYELGIEKPKTWDELYYALTILTRNQMTVGMPQGVAGLALLLYQRGGKLYTDDGTASNLADPLTLSAFKQLTSLFNEYSLPIQYDFANRFRSGEMPIGIVDFTMYNQLELYAPEIKGLWSMNPVPGTKNGDSIDHTSLSTVVGSYIMSKSDNQKRAWTFLKWWSGTEAQTGFALSMESLIGPSAKQATANKYAFEHMSWTRQEVDALSLQRNHLRSMPVYPGSYMLARNVGFAFNKVYSTKANSSDTLFEYIEEIDEEIARKCYEFGYPSR